jgi:hypothetical protein
MALTCDAAPHLGGQGTFPGTSAVARLNGTLDLRDLGCSGGARLTSMDDSLGMNQPHQSQVCATRWAYESSELRVAYLAKAARIPQ